MLRWEQSSMKWAAFRALSEKRMPLLATMPVWVIGRRRRRGGWVGGWIERRKKRVGGWVEETYLPVKMP